MQRIAIFVPSLEGGGMERVAVDLANGLGADDVAVDLVVAQDSGTYRADVADTVRIVDLKASRILRAIRPLHAYLRQQRPDALLGIGFHTNLATVAAVAGLRRRPRVVLSQHSMIRDQLRSLAPARRAGLRLLVHLTYRQADLVIIVSEGARKDLESLLGNCSTPLRVIYNPVSAARIRASASTGPVHPWLEDDGPPVVVSAGRLMPAKDQATLIRSFRLLVDTFPARLVLLGEGQERPRLEAMVAELELENHVDLPGFAPNPYASMVHASAFVLSSRYEGLGLVLIEALYLGLPVVSTDCPSGPREVLQGGRYGRLVPVGDPRALADAIRAALTGDNETDPAAAADDYELAQIIPQYREALLGR
jgi:glycosyltransferase involved in cell wall biosynthesis